MSKEWGNSLSVWCAGFVAENAKGAPMVRLFCFRQVLKLSTGTGLAPRGHHERRPRIALYHMRLEAHDVPIVRYMHNGSIERGRCDCMADAAYVAGEPGGSFAEAIVPTTARKKTPAKRKALTRSLSRLCPCPAHEDRAATRRSQYRVSVGSLDRAVGWVGRL